MERTISRNHSDGFSLRQYVQIRNLQSTLKAFENNPDGGEQPSRSEKPNGLVPYRQSDYPGLLDRQRLPRSGIILILWSERTSSLPMLLVESGKCQGFEDGDPTARREMVKAGASIFERVNEKATCPNR